MAALNLVIWASELRPSDLIGLTLLYSPMILSLAALNALLACFLSLSFTCGRLLRISCCLNMSISCELGCLCLSSSCLSNCGCLGLSGPNLTKGEACEGGGLVGC